MERFIKKVIKPSNGTEYTMLFDSENALRQFEERSKSWAFIFNLNY